MSSNPDKIKVAKDLEIFAKDSLQNICNSQGLSKKKGLIFQAILGADKYLSQKDLEKKTGLSHQLISYHMKDLIKKKLVLKVGKSPALYYLPDSIKSKFAKIRELLLMTGHKQGVREHKIWIKYKILKGFDYWSSQGWGEEFNGNWMRPGELLDHETGVTLYSYWLRVTKKYLIVELPEVLAESEQKALKISLEISDKLMREFMQEYRGVILEDKSCSRRVRVIDAHSGLCNEPFSVLAKKKGWSFRGRSVHVDNSGDCPELEFTKPDLMENYLDSLVFPIVEGKLKPYQSIRSLAEISSQNYLEIQEIKRSVMDLTVMMGDFMRHIDLNKWRSN